jgi:uncharacterized membrane protein
MGTGFLFLVGTGVCWAGLAAVTAAGAVRHAPAAKIQPYSAMLVLVCCGWIALFFGGAVPAGKVWVQVICLTAAGACNYFMLNLVQRAMKSGRNGVVWAFTQCSMMWPFLMGICCFGEPATLFRLAGFALIVCGLVLFARERKGGGAKGAWLLPTIGAFLLSGTAQCCASIPSYFQITGMSALRRMMLTQCGIILAFLIDSSIRHRLEVPRFHAEKNIWILAGAFGGLNLAALLFFYRGLNLLADAKCASAGYPVAQGLGIILFFLAGCRRNAPGLLSFCGFILVLLGISALAISGIRLHGAIL